MPGCRSRRATALFVGVVLFSVAAAADIDRSLLDSTLDLDAGSVAQRRAIFLTIIAAAIGVLALYAACVFAYRAGWLRTGLERLAARPRRSQEYALLATELHASDRRVARPVIVRDDTMPSSKWLEHVTDEELDVYANFEQNNRMSDNPRFVRVRWLALVLAFGVYVFFCLWIPFSHRSEVSCSRGFFWETHLQFLGVFVLTKAGELFLCVSDPTILWEIRPLDFAFKFCGSMLGYADGYTDATAITIALSCEDSFAQFLGRWMLAAYVFGVVFLQWLVAGCLALQDPSHGCLMKLVHMDVAASCVTLSDSRKRTWEFLHLARTFGEDLPQAVLQSLYIVNVNANYTMLLSVLAGLASSAKAAVDAYNRQLAAQGALGAWQASQLPGYVPGGASPALRSAASRTFMRGTKVAYAGVLRATSGSNIDLFDDRAEVDTYGMRLAIECDAYGRTKVEETYFKDDGSVVGMGKGELDICEDGLLRCRNTERTARTANTEETYRIMDGGLRLHMLGIHTTPTRCAEKRVLLLEHPDIPDPIAWVKANCFHQRPSGWEEALARYARYSVKDDEQHGEEMGEGTVVEMVEEAAEA